VPLVAAAVAGLGRAGRPDGAAIAGMKSSISTLKAAGSTGSELLDIDSVDSRWLIFSAVVPGSVRGRH
jgi:hypothetical protein